MVKHNCLNVSEQVIDILYILPKFDVIYDLQLVKTVQIQREEMKMKTNSEKTKQM